VRREATEFIGTMTLLVAIVGSGIATSVDGAASTQLFQHAMVVGLVLAGLIVVLLPMSGAHFNPAVTLAIRMAGGIDTRRAWRYVAAQVAGACAGVVIANLLFSQPAVAIGSTVRAGPALWASEVFATAGLVLVILLLVHTERTRLVPAAVGAWIGAAIFFTPSMAFANPAVSISRMLTDTWTAIAPASVPGFVIAQFAGAVAAVIVATWLLPVAIPAATTAVVGNGATPATEGSAATPATSATVPSATVPSATVPSATVPSATDRSTDSSSDQEHL